MLMTIGTTTDGHRQMVDMGVRLGSGHVVVQAPKYQEEQTLDHLVNDPAGVAAAAKTLPHVKHVAQRIAVTGLISSGETSAGVMIAGVEPDVEPLVSDIASAKRRKRGGYLRTRAQMKFKNNPADVYLGEELAKTLDVNLGDRVVLTASAKGGGKPASAAFYVRGTFQTNVSDIDSFMVQIPIDEARALLKLGKAATQVALLLDNQDQTLATAAALKARIGNDAIKVMPWQEALKELYDALVIDNGGGYVTMGIVFLIVCIGIFNTMLMSVMERTREFGVMMAIGTNQRRMFGIVVAEASVLGLVATLVGIGIGLGLHYWIASVGIDVAAMAGGKYEFAGIAFDGRMYSTLMTSEVIYAACGVFAMVVLSSIYPAWRATRLQPVEAMRHA